MHYLLIPKNHLLKKNRNYRKLWLANNGSLMGDWFNQVALGQITLNMTHSPASMGFVLLCRSLPSVLLGPLVSPIIDHFPIKKILIVSDLLRMIVVFLFPIAYFSHKSLFLFIGALCMGISSIMFTPAQQAAFPLIVAKQDLVKANTLSSGTNGFISIVGALFGGIISSAFQPAICFLINSLSYAWSALCLNQLHMTTNRIADNEKSSYFSSLKQGFNEVLHNKVARAIILIGISWGFAGGGYTILIPILGDITFRMGGFGIGILYAIDGLGVLIGALFVNKIVGNNEKRANLWYGLAYLFQAMFFAFLAQSTVFIFGAILLFFMRFSSGIIIPLDSYLLQIYTEPKVRGRVFSLHNSTYSGVMQLSYACLGYFFEKFGIPAVGIIIGIISFLCGLTWLFGLKSFFPHQYSKENNNI